MKRLALAGAAAALLATTMGPIRAGGDAGPDPDSFALVIGINSYPNLGPGEQLRGAVGDARAVRRLLIDRFGFAEANVTTLIDAEATGAAIRRELNALADRVRSRPAGGPPARVVLHYSGHGSQVPDQPAGQPGHDEADGKDETLVPHDATRQGGPEDIRDDELFAWAQAVGAGGRARAFVILDCCHSGTGLRGDLPVRQLVRGEPDGISPQSSAPGEVFEGETLPRGVVALSACRAGEVEPEYRDGDESNGLLTRFLLEVLASRDRVSALSYRSLRDAIAARYAAGRGVPAPPPAPQLEGDLADLDARVLGAGPEQDRPPYYQVEVLRGGRATLRAGRLHGLGPGSRLAVFARPEAIGDGSPPVAQLALTSCDLLRSEGMLEGTAPPDLKAGFAVPRGGERGGGPALRLKVLRDGQVLKQADLPPIVAESLRGAVGPDEAPWLELAESADGACDLVLKVTPPGTEALLISAGGRREVGDGESPWAPLPLSGPQAIAKLSGALRKYARVGNLLRLATEGAGGPLGSAVKLELIEVQEADESNRILQYRPWAPDSDGEARVRSGRLFALKVTNTRRDKPVYVSVLTINPETLAIKAVLPPSDSFAGTDQHKLAPGQSRIGALMRSGTPAGLRHAFLLATEEEHDVSYLAQDALPATRPVLSDLDATLAREAFFRGVKPRAAASGPPPWGVSVLSWRAEGPP